MVVVGKTLVDAPPPTSCLGFESLVRPNIVTGLDGLGTTLIPWVSNHKVGSIPTVTTKR